MNVLIDFVRNPFYVKKLEVWGWSKDFIWQLYDGEKV